jgi:general secretion pathway protein F
MASFFYRAYTAQGELDEGEIEARSREEAEDMLWARGLTPFETRATGGGGAKAGAKSGRSIKKRLKPADVAAFTRDFATLEEADVPLDRALRILSEQAPNPTRRELTEEVLRRLLDGATLSDSLAATSSAFGDGYISVVRAGETMGDLGSALAQMAEMLERRQELRARIQSALVYPAVLIVLALASTGIVIAVLAPAVAPIFAESGKPMPGGLQFIMGLEDQWPYILGFIVFLVGFFFWFRSYAAARPPVQLAVDRRVLDLPVIGAMKAQYDTSQFARTLGAMLKAGVPLLQGLESAVQSVGNHFLREQLGSVVDSVRNGGSLSRGLAEIKHLPTVVPQLVAVGEEAGQLAPMLLRVASSFERATERSIERAMSLLTPLLTIMIAGLVGALVLTVMNAVLGINELATQ